MKTQEAKDFFGGIRPMADALGITEQAIYQWGENVPELRSYHIMAVMADERKIKSKRAF